MINTALGFQIFITEQRKFEEELYQIWYWLLRGLQENTAAQTLVVMIEYLANIMEHSPKKANGGITVLCYVKLQQFATGVQVTLEFIDNGEKFDSLKAFHPIAEHFGLQLVQKLSNGGTYRYTEGNNNLVLTIGQKRQAGSRRD